MRKILILTLIGILSSCSIKDKSYPVDKENPNLRAVEFKYKGHDMVTFYIGNYIGTVHSPECKKCFQVYD